jgi:formylglycine-generating enzyme required for sulfatase activity
VEWQLILPGDVVLEFVLIPPGEFLMGSTPEEQTRFLEEAQVSGGWWARSLIPFEGPQHRVQLSHPFYLGKCEVTQAQWEAVASDNPSKFKALQNPVDSVSWLEIQPVLTNLNRACDVLGMKFVLPAEAQWEYACRAGTTTPWHCAANEASLHEFSWFAANSGRMTKPVGEKLPNAWGLYDMHGNVWEWCADWHSEDYYAQSPQNDPRGPTTGLKRVARGGSKSPGAWNCRSASRGRNTPDDHRDTHGLRMACEIPPKPVELDRLRTNIKSLKTQVP